MSDVTSDQVLAAASVDDVSMSAQARQPSPRSRHVMRVRREQRTSESSLSEREVTFIERQMQRRMLRASEARDAADATPHLDMTHSVIPKSMCAQQLRDLQNTSPVARPLDESYCPEHVTSKKRSIDDVDHSPRPAKFTALKSTGLTQVFDNVAISGDASDRKQASVEPKSPEQRTLSRRTKSELSLNTSLGSRSFRIKRRILQSTPDAGSAGTSVADPLSERSAAIRRRTQLRRARSFAGESQTPPRFTASRRVDFSDAPPKDVNSQTRFLPCEQSSPLLATQLPVDVTTTVPDANAPVLAGFRSFKPPKVISAFGSDTTVEQLHISPIVSLPHASKTNTSADVTSKRSRSEQDENMDCSSSDSDASSKMSAIDDVRAASFNSDTSRTPLQSVLKQEHIQVLGVAHLSPQAGSVEPCAVMMSPQVARLRGKPHAKHKKVRRSSRLCIFLCIRNIFFYSLSGYSLSKCASVPRNVHSVSNARQKPLTVRNHQQEPVHGDKLLSTQTIRM